MFLRLFWACFLGPNCRSKNAIPRSPDCGQHGDAINTEPPAGGRSFGLKIFAQRMVFKRRRLGGDYLYYAVDVQGESGLFTVPP